MALKRPTSRCSDFTRPATSKSPTMALAARWSPTRHWLVRRATLYEKLNFNFINDIAPVAGLIRIPFVMEVNPSVPAKTVPEFIAYAKANPGKTNVASAGNGTTGHVAGELFKMMA